MDNLGQFDPHGTSGEPVEYMDVPDLTAIRRLDAHIAGFCAGIGTVAVVLIVGPAIGAVLQAMQ